MDLIQYINESKSQESNIPTIDEIISTLKSFINKKESLTSLNEIKRKLLVVSRKLLANTVKLNKVIDTPEFEKAIDNLTNKKSIHTGWASKLISIPLLRSCIDQLEKATTGQQMALAISRIIGMVEDAEETIETPYEPRIQGGEPNYHQIYKYLVRIAGWDHAKVTEVDETFAIFRDRLVKQLLSRIAKKSTLKLPRPAGW